MQAVLMSIGPKWCEKIGSRKKGWEIRKTRPKLQTPFKCYIYCTSRDPHLCLMQNASGLNLIYAFNYKTAIPFGGKVVNGKVIGEFVCDRIEEVYQCHSGWVAENACLSRFEFFEYLGIPYESHLGYDKKAYAWHISDLVIYDTPKELSEFYVWKKCNSCRKSGYESTACGYDEDCKVPAIITRPPQSWYYVEAI